MAKRGRKPFKCAYCEQDLHIVLRPIFVEEFKQYFCEIKCLERYRFEDEQRKLNDRKDNN